MLQVYDRVLTSRSLSTLLALSLLAVALYAFYGAFDWIRSCLLVRVSQAFDRQLAGGAFISTVVGNSSEKAQAAQDLKQFQQFVGGPAIATLFDVPWFPFYLTIVFLLHPWLGYMSLGGALILVIIAALTEFTSRGQHTKVASVGAEEDKLLFSARRQGELLTAMGMAGNLEKHWRVKHDAKIELSTIAADRQNILATLAKTMRLILQSAILGFGAYLVIENQVSAGALIAASIIFARALAPLDQSIAHWRTISAAQVAYRRLKSSLANVDTGEVETVLRLPAKSLSITDLQVDRPDKQGKLLEGVTISLQAGDGLGIIGATGSGKSTLVRGILGLLALSRGEVRLDGATLDQWSDADRGRIIGYLPQDLELLPGTIGQNIARFDVNATSQQVLAAAQIADVHELIVSKPNGYDTIVGPGGHMLSGGERQRIALARAAFGNPFLLVLDEPNSNMDGKGEIALSKMIKSLRERGAIVIVVTHRQAVISQLNKLMQVEAGKVALFGETEAVLQHLREQHRQRSAGSLRVVD